WRLGCAFLSLDALDQTAHVILPAWNTGRLGPKQLRAHCRKCPLAPTTDHPQTTSETTIFHQERSHAPRPAGQADSNLAASPRDCSTRHEARGFHRELFRWYWKRKSKAASRKPKVAAETIALIRQMAREN